MTTRAAQLAAALYLAVGIITFGHAAAHADIEYLSCKQRAEVNTFCPRDAGPSGMAAFMFWPFYWSWEAFS